MSVYREAKPFFDKYRELSQEAPVIPIDCNNYGARDTRIEWPLRLAGLADEGDLRFFHEEEKWQEVLSTIAIPSYVLTERDAEFLAQVAPGFQVVPVPNASYIGCSFYLIRHSQVSNEATGEAVPAQWP